MDFCIKILLVKLFKMKYATNIWLKIYVNNYYWNFIVEILYALRLHFRLSIIQIDRYKANFQFWNKSNSETNQWYNQSFEENWIIDKSQWMKNINLFHIQIFNEYTPFNIMNVNISATMYMYKFEIGIHRL